MALVNEIGDPVVTPCFDQGQPHFVGIQRKQADAIAQHGGDDRETIGINGVCLHQLLDQAGPAADPDGVSRLLF